MKHLSTRVRIAVTLLLAAGVLGWFMTRESGLQVMRVGHQEAAPPLLMPADGQVDHRFDTPSPWLTAQIPTARRFDPPMGRLVYNAQKFWDMNEKRGGHHSGDDLNGIGGMNSDLGDPVWSVADGLVLYAGEPSSGWGKTVIIAHRTTDGRMLHSMYAHLDRMDVACHSLVARGQRIGTVGTGNDHYPAHLHFEMRDSDYIDLDGGYLKHPRNRLDPMATVAALRGVADEDLSPSPLATAMGDRHASWTELQIEGAEIFSRLRGEP